jgi:hypothetical protein
VEVWPSQLPQQTRGLFIRGWPGKLLVAHKGAWRIHGLCRGRRAHPAKATTSITR